MKVGLHLYSKWVFFLFELLLDFNLNLLM
jgi:hypothetical protein